MKQLLAHQISICPVNIMVMHKLARNQYWKWIANCWLKKFTTSMALKWTSLTLTWTSITQMMTWNQATLIIIRLWLLCKTHLSKRGNKLSRFKCHTIISPLSKLLTIVKKWLSKLRSTCQEFGKIVRNSWYHRWLNSRSNSTIQMSFTSYSSLLVKVLLERRIRYQIITNSNIWLSQRFGILIYLYSCQRMDGKLIITSKIS